MCFSEHELLANYHYRSPQPLLIDVGAHRGGGALRFAKKGWRVIAFEPEPRNRAGFERNLAGFDQVSCIPKAVSDVTGDVVPFYVSDEHYGIHSLKPFHKTHRLAFEVETVCLNDVLAELNVSSATLLKVDIEGADFSALKGFDFSKYRPELVMIEFMDERSSKHFGYTHHDVAAYMAEQGYATFVSEWAPIKEYAREGMAVSHVWLQCAPYPLNHEPAWGNLIFVPTADINKFKATLRAYLNKVKIRERIGKIPGAQALSILPKAFRVLMNEGPFKLGGMVASRVAVLLFRHPNILRQLAANWEWRQKVKKIKPDIDEYSNAWGAAKRALYGKWGPLPCSQSEVKRLQSLHNMYQGERIFIIGNGPSLNKTPLEKLEGEYTFGVNRIYLLFDRIRWRPTFYTAFDWQVTPDNRDEINALRGMTFFFPKRFQGLLRTGDDVYWYWLRNGFPNGGRSVKDRFSYDITKGICQGGTVIVPAIQIAYYLGFDPIYLIGVDTDYKIADSVKQSGPDCFGDGVGLYLESTKDDDVDHFDPRYFGKGRKWHNPNVPGMVRGHENCRAAIDAQGRHIYNATIGGKLEAFERVDFDTLF